MRKIKRKRSFLWASFRWRLEGSGQVKWGGEMPTMLTRGNVGALPLFARPVQMLTTESETDR